MKTIGLLGGMSWESTKTYYELINRQVKKRLGGSHSAKILMYSYDYFELEEMLISNDHKKLEASLIFHAKKLENAGADYLMICANTMHIYYQALTKHINIPVLHIAESVLKKVKEKKINHVLLLGTKYTMQSLMYSELFKRENVKVSIPSLKDQERIHEIIYKELILGKIIKKSRDEMLSIISSMQPLGIEGVVLGCTEIPLLIKPSHLSLPIFDTTKLHALSAVNEALSK